MSFMVDIRAIRCQIRILLSQNVNLCTQIAILNKAFHIRNYREQSKAKQLL